MNLDLLLFPVEIQVRIIGYMEEKNIPQVCKFWYEIYPAILQKKIEILFSNRCPVFSSKEEKSQPKENCNRIFNNLLLRISHYKNNEFLNNVKNKRPFLNFDTYKKIADYLDHYFFLELCKALPPLPGNTKPKLIGNTLPKNFIELNECTNSLKDFLKNYLEVKNNPPVNDSRVIVNTAIICMPILLNEFDVNIYLKKKVDFIPKYTNIKLIINKSDRYRQIKKIV